MHLHIQLVEQMNKVERLCNLLSWNNEIVLIIGVKNMLDLIGVKCNQL